jgi:hypothetical protein
MDSRDGECEGTQTVKADPKGKCVLETPQGEWGKKICQLG